MNPSNTIINKVFPDNQVITEWTIARQLYWIEAWKEKEYNSKLKRWTLILLI